MRNFNAGLDDGASGEPCKSNDLDYLAGYHSGPNIESRRQAYEDRVQHKYPGPGEEYKEEEEEEENNMATMKRKKDSLADVTPLSLDKPESVCYVIVGMHEPSYLCYDARIIKVDDWLHLESIIRNNVPTKTCIIFDWVPTTHVVERLINYGYTVREMRFKPGENK